ncbi:MAG: hypothetical protein OEV66_07150 [Spirochaetia bacterium]|nr:hypothetical protein [Spirochaetia bacterium]
MFQRAGIATVIFFLITTMVNPEEIWNTWTHGDKDVTKKFLNLGLQFNFIYYKPSENSKKTSLLMINEGKPQKWFLKTIVEKFGTDISVMEYQTSQPFIYNEAQYRALRIKNYLKTSEMMNSWPPLFLEVQEIHLELGRGDYGEKILLLSGTQSNLLNQTKIISDFERLIILSPDESLENMTDAPWKNKKVLWMGALYEKSKLQKLQSKFGGVIQTYERSSTGKNLLLSNLKVLDDIYNWIKG